MGKQKPPKHSKELHMIPQKENEVKRSEVWPI